jgi:hypothetical protein
MQDRLLQRALANVVVKRRAGHAQKQRELRPVLEHVGDRAAQARIGLDPMLVELLPKPALELCHAGAALGMVELQALLGRQCALARPGIAAVDLAQGLQHQPDLRGEVLDHLDEAPARVREAIGEQRFELADGVTGQGIATLTPVTSIRIRPPCGASTSVTHGPSPSGATAGSSTKAGDEPRRSAVFI